MNARSLTAIALGLVLLPEPAIAQRFLLSHSFPPGATLVDTSAGAIVEEAAFALNFLPGSAGLQVADAELVDGEVWIAADLRIHRFDAVTRSYLGSFQPGSSAPRGMEVVAGTVWVAAGSELLELDLAGNPVASHPATSAEDVLAWSGELLVSNSTGNRVERFDLSGNPVGVLVDDPGGAFLQPGQLAPLAGGNLLVTTLGRLFEVDPAGSIVRDYQVGVLEQGVQQMSDGRLFVSTLGAAGVFDAAVPLGAGFLDLDVLTASFSKVSPFDDGNGAYQRTCVRTPNSAGDGASFFALGLASVSAPTGSLHLSVSGLPEGEPGQFVYGLPSAAAPFGDGFLCLPSTGAFRLPGTIAASASGRVERPLLYSLLTPAGAITAGSTWSFQYLYRDLAAGGVGFNASDAVTLTFQL